MRDLPERAQDSPFLEQREAEAAFLRIGLALQVAALRARNRDIERPLLVVADQVVGHRDGDPAERFGAPKDVPRPEISVGNLLDVIVDCHLELKLAAPGSQPDLGFDDARELERIPFDLRGLQEKRRAEAREIIALPSQRLLGDVVTERNFGEGVADRLAHHGAVRADLDLPHRGRVDQRRLVRRAVVDGSPPSVLPVIVDARKRATMPDDQHDGRRVRIGGRQIERLDRAGYLGLQLEHALYLGRQRLFVDGRRVEGYLVLQFDLEGVVELAVVAELSGEVKALRILEGFAFMEICPDASAELIWLPVKLLRPCHIELLLDNGGERGDALFLGEGPDPS
ncbi:hypothetical protein A6302_04495 [Methylobrevis pamukkalensis]|uniref:Uncharacterized protein n=1 Tax=Methylobrevis pamukkalensis TaxID=1439726 RepID=A0A1E3GP51_9HYPH|nr:hypothetical protein A6302_04495 [Methylobrevis pamukkalensis]